MKGCIICPTCHEGTAVWRWTSYLCPRCNALHLRLYSREHADTEIATAKRPMSLEAVQAEYARADMAIPERAA